SSSTPMPMIATRERPERCFGFVMEVSQNSQLVDRAWQQSIHRWTQMAIRFVYDTSTDLESTGSILDVCSRYQSGKCGMLRLLAGTVVLIEQYQDDGKTRIVAPLTD
ncbi:MAG: hypothetical protein AB8G99_08900, partial [Planctomycetaceae bacterium]